MKHKIVSKLLSGVIVLAGCAGLSLLRTTPVRAAPLTFTVNSTANTVDASVGNGSCETSTPGVCTLRAAIQEANSNVGPDTINFNISGSGVHVIDSTSSAGYTITSPVTINGYSPDSTANTAVSPNPFNADLKINIQGNHLGSPLFYIPSGGSGTTIKGLAISNIFTQAIVSLHDANDITIQGNYLGVGPDGLTDVTYSRGVLIDNTPSTISTGLTIGGPDAEDRNLGYVELDIFNTSGTTIQGNYLGLDKTGLASLGVGGNVGTIYSDTNTNLTIGGSSTSDGNVISGRTTAGLELYLGNIDGLTLSNNKVGTNYDGSASLENSVTASMDTVTDAVIDSNTFSGSAANGLGIDNSSDTSVTNNTIGLTSDGASIIGNSQYGLRIANSDSITVGTTGNGNTISGNTQSGLELSNVTNSTVSDNNIGTDNTGQTNLSNGDSGILMVSGSDSNTIESNIISGNALDGLSLDSSSSNTIQGNIIGRSADTTVSLPNGAEGIHVSNGSANNMIGGTSGPLANTIQDNTNNGILVEGGASTGNSILRNSIYNNSNLGIDLGDNGVTVNDSNDADAGPNNNLNYPASVTYQETGGNTVMRFNLDAPAGNYRIEFFSNTAADGSGYGQGEAFLGSTNVTSSGSGSQSFTNTLTGVSHANISGTATRITSGTPTYGDSSEFSATATLYTPPPPVQDIGVTKSIVNPGTVSVGNNMQYDITFTNHGPDDIELTDFDGTSLGQNDLFIDILPPNLTFVSTTSPSTITCTSFGPNSASLFGPAMSNHSTSAVVLCDYTDATSHVLHQNESIVTRISVSVDSNPGSFTNHVLSVGTVANDPDSQTISDAYGSGGDIIDYFVTHPINNVDSAVYPIPETDTGISITLANPQDVGPNQSISYTFSFTNHGPTDLDIADLDGGQGSNLLATNVLPPELTPENVNINTGNITSTSNARVACQYLGPGSASYAGTLLGNHSNYALINCASTGGSYILQAGDSLDFTLSFQLNANPPTTFANYAFTIPLASDPDYTAFLSVYNSGQDMIDYYSIHTPPNNYALASYTAASSNSGSTTIVKSLLADTGENKLLLISLALVATGIFSSLCVLSRKM